MTDRLRIALAQFQDAAEHLVRVWEQTTELQGPLTSSLAIAEYPAYLPSFDEFVADIQRMEVR